MIRMMALCCGLVMVGLTGLAHASDKPDRAEARAALAHAKVHLWRQLYRNNDVAGLKTFLSDDFVIIGANGSEQTKADILKEMEADPWTMPDDFLYTVTGIIFPTDDSAIVYGHGDSTRQSAEGWTCAHNYTSSNVFRLDGDRWRPVSSHVSDSSCEPL